MGRQWFYSRGSQQLGPVSEEELRRLIDQRSLLPQDLVWNESMADWKTAGSISDLFPSGASDPPPRLPPADSSVASTKLTAGICALAAGSFGVHKFVLGMPNPGIVMLVVSVATCFIGGIVMHIIAVIEGIKYLTMSDEEFRDTYMVGKKEWF